jgi:hypothetical protein
MAALAAAVGIVVFFAWANRQTAKAHARFTAKDVDDALSELLAPDARDHDTWERDSSSRAAKTSYTAVLRSIDDNEGSRLR